MPSTMHGMPSISGRKNQFEKSPQLKVETVGKLKSDYMSVFKTKISRNPYFGDWAGVIKLPTSASDFCFMVGGSIDCVVSSQVSLPSSW